MRNMNKVANISAFLVLCIMPALSAQKQVTLIPSESKILITGTSNLHDWEEKVEKFDVSLLLLTSGAGDSRISDVSFISKAVSVVSDNSIMTGKTHDALQVKKYPEIKFRTSDQTVLDLKGNKFTGSLTGELILNGVTKKIKIDFSGTLSGDRIEVSGSQTLSMADYNIKPPTAILGTLKTGDKVTVTYSLKFKIG